MDGYLSCEDEYCVLPPEVAFFDRKYLEAGMRIIMHQELPRDPILSAKRIKDVVKNCTRFEAVVRLADWIPEIQKKIALKYARPACNLTFREVKSVIIEACEYRKNY